MIKFDLNSSRIIASFYDTADAPYTGLTDVVFYIYRLSDLQFWDWDDSSFKASGWTDIDGTGIEINATNAAGDYYISWTPPADGAYVVRANSPTAANVDPKDVVDVYSRFDTDLNQINTGVAQIDSNISLMQGDIVTINGNIAVVQSDITIIKDDIATIQSDSVQTKVDLAFMKKIRSVRRKVVNNQEVYYDDDKETPLLVFDLFRNGQPSMVNVDDKVPV